MPWFLYKSIFFFFFLNFSHFVVVAQTDSVAAEKYFDIGEGFFVQNPDSAVFYYRKATKYYANHGAKEEQASCYLAMGACMAYHDKLDSSQKYFLIAIDSAESLLGIRHYYYFLSQFNLAAIYYFKTQYDKAIKIHEELIRKIEVLPDSIKNFEDLQDLQIHILTGLSSNYGDWGDFESGLRYIQQAQLLRKEFHDPDPRQVAVEHSIAAACLIDLRRYLASIVELRKCLTILNQQDVKEVSRDYIDAYHKMAFCYLKLGYPDSASRMLDLADPLQAIGAKRRPQNGITIRGDIAFAKEAYDEAIDYYSQSIELWKETLSGRTKSQTIGRLFGKIGRVHQKIQNFDQALTYFQIALAANHEAMTGNEAVSFFPPVKSLTNSVSSITVFDKKAQVLIDRNKENTQDRVLAQHCYMKVDSLFLRILREIRSSESQAFFSEEFRPIYERAIDNCYMLYQQTGNIAYLTQAFAYSERSKAILLSLALRDSKAKIEGGLPSEVLEKEYQLRTDIAAYRKRIFGAKASTDSLVLDSWRNKLFEMEEDFRKLVASMETDYPNYYQVKYGVVTVTPAQVQTSLRGKDHQLIAYFLGDSALYRFVFSKGNIAMNKQENWAEGQSHFERLLPLLQTPSLESLGPFKEHAYGLYQALFPYPSNDAPQQLTIIPDGQLGFLPFGVLLSKQAAPSDGFRDLPYVCQRTQINYGYSATLLGTSFIQKTAFNKKLSAFAPAYEAELRLSTNQPQAKAVVEQVGGHAFLASAATEAAFKQTAQTSRILHLAMHGVPDVEQSLYAHMLFGPSTDSVEDGKLHAYELYNLSLNTQLVTLSACETGYGKLAEGEGVMSLARAFRYSGCQSILFSHWKVDGRAANELLAGFYEAIGEGKRPSVAIWQSQKDFLAAAPPDQVHPFYWANFVLTGEDRALSAPFSRWWWGGGLLVVILLMGYFIFSLRKNKRGML